MLVGALAAAVLAVYAFTPGDTSERPYPTNYEDMVQELRKMEELYGRMEKEFLESKVRMEVLTSNNIFSPETHEAVNHYNLLATARHGIECRIKNLSKLIEKYEEINNVINVRHSNSISVGEG
jgi:predicted transcriptional regulator